MRKEIRQNNQIQDDNRGITLIEVLVTLAIVGVVTTVVAGFYITSLNLYKRVTRDANLQNEAQLAFTQIQSMAVNASDGVGLGEGVVGTKGSDLYIYNHVSTTCEITHVYREDDKLYYCKIPYEKLEGADTPTMGQDKQNPVVIAEYLTGFSVDMTNFTQNNSIDIQMDFENRDRDYTSKNTIYMRNQLVKKISGSAAEYFARTDSLQNARKYTNFQLTPAVVYLWPNTTTYYPVTAEVSADGLTFTEASHVVWSVASSETTATINRNTGALTIGDASSGGQGTISASVASGDETNTTLEAAATYYTKDYTGLKITSQPQPASANNYKTYTATLTVEGRYLEPSVDMSTMPVVVEGSELNPTFTRDDTLPAVGSVLRWKVSIKRPAEYKGNSYRLAVSYTLNGKTETASTSWFQFSESTEEKGKTIEKVRLVDNKGNTYESGGTIDASRGGTKNLTMQAKYSDSAEWVTLDSDEWKITPDNSAVRATAGGGGYNLAMGVKDYTRTVTVSCATKYFRAGQNGNGPTIQLRFSPVTIALDNGAPSTQKTYPVTCGTTEQMSFTVANMEGASLMLLDKSDEQDSSTMRISMSGTNASVTVASGALHKMTFYFGVRAADGTELPSSISCEVGMMPGTANLYLNTAMNQAADTFIPLLNNSFKQYDSTKSIPKGSGTVQIYTLSKGVITYSATSEACMYRMSYNGSNYKFGNPEYRISGWIRN